MNTRGTTPTPNMEVAEFNEEMSQAQIEREAEIAALTGGQEDNTDDGGTGAEPDRTARQQEEEPDDKPIPMSPGDAARARIANRFKREADPVMFNGDMTDPANLYGEVAQVALEPDPALPEPGVPDDTTARVEPQAEETFTIKVRGKDVTLTRAELIERASKVEAADSYLEETRDMLRQAKEAGKKNGAPDSQHPENTGDADDGQDTNPDRSPRRPGDDTRSVVEKIQFGDPEEAAAALDELINQRADQRATSAQEQRLIKNDLAKSQQALAAFKAANPELSKHKHVAQLMENEVYDIYRSDLKNLGLADDVIPRNPADVAAWARHYRMNGHAVSTAAEVLEKAKEAVVKVIHPSLVTGQPAPKPKGAPVVQVNVDRSERRAAIPNQPTRAVAPRPNAQQQAPAKKSASDIVNEMRRQRGQPTA